MKTYNTLKQGILLFSLNLCYFLSFGQQDAQFTHYMYVTQLANSAYVGTVESLRIDMLYRTQ